MVCVSTPDLPVAIRATVREKRSILGAKRVYTYDVRFANGAEERDVNIDDVLQGGRYPADAWAARHAAEKACRDTGPGAWVRYPSGCSLDG